MLTFDVRSLTAHAAPVDGRVELGDPVWTDEDLRPAGPLRVVGRLSVAGPGRYYFSGTYEGVVELECRRCLTSLRLEVGGPARALFSEADTDAADDPDVFDLTDGGRTVDLRPAIREQWLLDVPAFAVCRPECRGLCAGCGTDLNVGECTCAPVTDRRWAGLRPLGR